MTATGTARFIGATATQGGQMLMAPNNAAQFATWTTYNGGVPIPAAVRQSRWFNP
jgi:hypothetical protein